MVATWSKSFEVDDRAGATSVAVSTNRDVLLSGYVTGAIDFGGGVHEFSSTSGVFIARLNAHGDHIWSHTYGFGLESASTTDDIGGAVLAISAQEDVDLGGGILENAGYEDVSVVRFDSAGDHRWSRRFHDYRGPISQVFVDGEDNIVLVGDLYQRSFVAKLDPEGNLLWDLWIPIVDIVADVAPDGRIAFGGAPTDAIDFGSEQIQMPSDIVVAVFDSDGSYIWSWSYDDGSQWSGDGIPPIGTDLADLSLGPMNEIALIGMSDTTGGLSAFLIALDAHGKLQWEKRFEHGPYTGGVEHAFLVVRQRSHNARKTVRLRDLLYVMKVSKRPAR